MQAVQLLHNFCEKSCVGIHTKRLQALFKAVDALIIGGKLSLAGLGRALKTKAKAKNNIKLIDRLLGNKKLYQERANIYQATITLLINSITKPLLIIDWSPLPDPNFYLLRASVAIRGRSLTMYEEVHPTKKQNNNVVHKKFLKKLHGLLPKNCLPIITTDAGFHSPFFKEVINLGWHYAGRIRGKVKYRAEDSSLWEFCKDLYTQATKTPKYVGKVTLSKSNPIACNIVIYKGKAKGRIAKGKLGLRRENTKNKKHAQGNKEPWVLVTSLAKTYNIAKKVVHIYQCRMQIEESFRDLKSSKTGFNLKDSKTYNLERFAVLLLIGMLASLALYLVGMAGEQRKLHYDYQANTIRNRAVLSLFFLGWQIMKQNKSKFTKEELLLALYAINGIINEQINEG